MKTMLIAFAFGAVMGAGLAYTNTADHYEDKARALREAQRIAEANRADAIHTLSSKYYAIYQDAVNREPATVVERVFVKANCPVRAQVMPEWAMKEMPLKLNLRPKLREALAK